ncbi:hypothetical protein VIN30_01080 [Adlercreutzia sp. R7]|uniref:Uncharacterized protein n=1 Tax=Adlercreutzia wanghongyangiae TaxID=3111451 RepID=A0ABU6IF23_9ACTN|nr:hypothetical protein [Adlercreutzia sp. R7]
MAQVLYKLSVALTDKGTMGVDYGAIAVKGCRDRKPGHHHDRGCSRR